MLLEQVYLLFIYILFIELAIVTVVAIALFVALVVAIRKIDSKKNTSLLDR
jgi:AAA+ ATPase superfamily predicted ATPase